MILRAQYFDKIEVLVSEKEEKKTKIMYLVLTLKSEVVRKVQTFSHVNTSRRQ